VDYTFFGVQIAVKAFFKDPLRQQLAKVIAESEAQQTLFEKRAFWKRLCAVLNEAMPVFELGYWDLIRAGKAQEEFETWCSEIEGALASEREEMGAGADEVNRVSANKDYILLTAAVLVEQGSNSDLILGERCDLPESEYFTRQTMSRLVGSFPLLNFVNVQADAVYLMPGSEDDGFSLEDLFGGGYEYLKPLT
jgi:hypothetical protein